MIPENYVRRLIKESAVSGGVTSGYYTDERAEALQHHTEDYEDDGSTFTARGDWNGEPWEVQLERDE